MSTTIEAALKQDRTIDITTIGRKSGQPRRIEIWFHNINGRLFITGLPGKRSWYANLVANPEFTFHLKESVQADISGKATPILDKAERRTILAAITGNLDRADDLDTWVAESPLVELDLHI